MSLILVVEQEGRYIERIRDALGSEGWRTKVVGGQPEALRAASSEAPGLVLVNSEVAGADRLFASFARRNGGPGVVALVPEHLTGELTADGLAVDEVLAKPFTDQDLRLVVRRSLAGLRQAASRPEPSAPATAERGELTSQEIFGDLVAEIEGELARATAAAEAEPPAEAAQPAPPAEATEQPPEALEPASPPEAAEPAVEAGEPPPAPAVAEPPPPALAEPPPLPEAARLASPRARPRSLDDADIARRLEETLSGVLTAAITSPEQPTVRSRRPSPDEEVDALLSETLSGLQLEQFRGADRDRDRQPRAPAETVEAAAPAEPDEPPPVPGALPQLEFEDPLADFDLSALAEPAPGDEPVAAGEEPVEIAAPEDDVGPIAEPPPLDLPTLEMPALEAEEAPPAEEPRLEPPPLEPPPLAGPSAHPEASQFGQYTLLERIAVGGMAEVWKARMRGVEGFQKTVAIKKILPHLTDGADFVSMFIDEAKLAAQLTHPNIIHIYDLGKIGDHYFIAMEYVEGRDLRSILNAARDKGMPVPVDLALMIGARLASALDYAHRKRDFDQRDLGLVHRDVSPQNILVSYEGDIKLCDFGIAKAVAKVSQTQMGALKGKLQYMSPEQAWGRPVDPRSDIFSLGSLLFEMLTGQRLFGGDNEISVLEAVRECHVDEPGTLSPEIPPEADEIVMRALAKEPEDRYQSAGDLQQALEHLLHTRQTRPGSSDLAAYLQRLTAGEVQAESEGDAKAAEEPEPEALAGASPTAEQVPPATELAAPTGDEESAPALSIDEEVLVDEAPAPADESAAPEGEALPDIDREALPDVEAVAPAGPVAVEEAPGRGRGLLIAAILILLAAGIAAYLYLRATRPPAPAESPLGPAAVETAVAAGEPAEEPPAETSPDAQEPAADDEAGADAKAASPDQTALPEGADVQALIDEELAKREREIRRKLEAEERRLLEELEKAKARQREEAPEAAPEPSPAPPEESSASLNTRDPAASVALVSLRRSRISSPDQFATPLPEPTARSRAPGRIDVAAQPRWRSR